METRLSISGMSCGHCVKAVKAALEDIDGVTEAKVELTPGSAVVVHDGSVTPERLVSAITEEGYTAQEAL
jgi:copper chaperone